MILFGTTAFSLVFNEWEEVKLYYIFLKMMLKVATYFYLLQWQRFLLLAFL